MKTRHYLIALTTVIMAFPFILSSCKKDSSSNPASSNAELKIQAVNPFFKIPITGSYPGSSMATVNWTTANMMVSSITYEFVLASSGGGSQFREVENEWVGPAYVNLFDLSESPIKITIPRGVYSEIEFKVYSNVSDSHGNPLLTLTGTFTSSQGKVYPIAIYFRDNIYLRAEKENVTIGSNVTNFSPIIQLYLDKLFTNILPGDLNNLAIQSDGSIVISSTVNSQIYQEILKNLGLAAGSRFGDD